MELNERYKQTDLGTIPIDWEIKSIEQLNLDISDGNYSSKYPKSSDFKEFGIPFIRANNIKNMRVCDDDMRFISPKQHSELLSGHLKKDDILITTRGELGNIAIVPDKHIDSNINAQIVRINTNKTIFYKYFAYFLSHEVVQKKIKGAETGSALKQLPKGRLIKLPVIIPPLPEQHAIAEALSDMDSLIAAQKALLAKKRAIKQGVMQELLTGKRRLPGFSGNWEEKKLGDVLKIKHGRSQNSIIDINGCYPILGTGGEIGKTNIFIYDKPSVLIGRKGTIDTPQYMDSPFWTIDTLFYSEIFGNAFPKYIFYLFNTIDWYAYNEASGVPSLNASTIENIGICLPSLNEQIIICGFLSDIDREINSIELIRDKTKALKQGIMQELLTGRIRLTGV